MNVRERILVAELRELFAREEKGMDEEKRKTGTAHLVGWNILVKHMEDYASAAERDGGTWDASALVRLRTAAQRLVHATGKAVDVPAYPFIASPDYDNVMPTEEAVYRMTHAMWKGQSDVQLIRHLLEWTLGPQCAYAEISTWMQASGTTTHTAKVRDMEYLFGEGAPERNNRMLADFRGIGYAMANGEPAVPKPVAGFGE